MKYSQLILLFFLSVSLCSQSSQIEITLDIDQECEIQDITIQSLVTGNVITLSQETIQQVQIFQPTDKVILIAQGKGSMQVSPTTYIEGNSNISITKEKGCENIDLSSEADYRLQELEAYLSQKDIDKEKKLIGLLNKNISSLIIHDYINDYVKGSFTNDNLSERIVTLLDKKHNPTTDHDWIKRQIAIVKSHYLPDTTPFILENYSLKAYENNSLVQKNSEYRLVDFWYTSCASCIKQHKLFKENIESGNFPENVMLIGLSIESDEKRWIDFLEKEQLPWLNYIIPSKNLDILIDYAIHYYPTYLLLDGEGNILHRLNSLREFNEIKYSLN